MNCSGKFGSGVFPNRSRNHRLFPLLLAVSCLAAGCASRPTVQLPEMASWEQRNTVLREIREWEFSGRIAVSTGDDGFNGKIRWTQDHGRFEASVSGPLGIGTVRIDGDGRSVVHTDKDGVRTELEHAEEELYYRYGWTIPIRSLRYWALGLPDPSFPAQTELNAEQQLARLEQSDWVVDISRYRVSSGQSMPSRLTANNSQTRVRIVIDKWKFFD